LKTRNLMILRCSECSQSSTCSALLHQITPSQFHRSINFEPTLSLQWSDSRRCNSSSIHR
jgi:hypothetical protein